MAAIKYKVELTEAERSRLNEVSQRGKASVRTVKRALSLLKADQGLRDREIADVLLVNPATVARARKRYVEEGLEAAINDRPWPGRGAQAGRPAGSAPDRLCVQRSARRTRALDTPVVGRPGGGVGVCREHLPGDGAPDTQKNELKPWKKMAEIELSVFSRGCLNRRISDEPERRREVAALERERNAAKSAIDWRFTTQDARRKLQHIYPIRSD